MRRVIDTAGSGFWFLESHIRDEQKVAPAAPGEGASRLPVRSQAAAGQEAWRRRPASTSISVSTESRRATDVSTTTKWSPFPAAGTAGWCSCCRLRPTRGTRCAAAAADGIDLRAVDSYRDWETQNRAHQEFLAGDRPANVPSAGHSQHGNGLAVDVSNGSIIGRDDPEWHWLRANGRRFGWYPISNETWHWEFRGLGAR